jgi:hypothetical protein
MKNVCLLTLAVMFLFQGCTEYSNQKMKCIISGIYVAKWNDEFAKTYDTLTIEGESENEVFQISQKMLSEFFNKSKMPVYKIHHWTGNYNAVNKCLLINNNGRMLFFFPERNELKSGTITFKKM